MGESVCGCLNDRLMFPLTDSKVHDQWTIVWQCLRQLLRPQTSFSSCTWIYVRIISHLWIFSAERLKHFLNRDFLMVIFETKINFLISPKIFPHPGPWTPIPYLHVTAHIKIAEKVFPVIKLVWKRTGTRIPLKVIKVCQISHYSLSNIFWIYLTKALRY